MGILPMYLNREDPGVQGDAPIMKSTHPEKKWAAGTNESKPMAQSLIGKSRLTRWVLRNATLGALQVTGVREVLGNCNHCGVSDE